MKKITLLLILLIISIGGFSQVFTAGIPQPIDVAATPAFKGLRLSRQITMPTISTGIGLFNVGGNLVVKDSVGTKTVPYLENKNVWNGSLNTFNFGVNLGGTASNTSTGDIVSINRLVFGTGSAITTSFGRIFTSSNSLYFQGGSSGLFFADAGLNPTGRMFSDGNWFLGPSPTNAGYKLDVNGTGRFSSNVLFDSRIGIGIAPSGNSSYKIKANLATDINFVVRGNGYVDLIGVSDNDGVFKDISLNSGVLYAKSSNNSVGIGTTTPNTKLSLGADIATIKVATFDDNSTLYGIGVAPFQLTFGAGIAKNGTPQMVLASTGNVGIGTTTDAGYKLDVSGTGRFQTSRVDISNAGLASLRLNNTNTNFWDIINTTSSGALEFNRGGAVFATISAGGNFGIGTAPTHTLTTGSTSTGFAQYNTSDQTTNYERVRQFWNANNYIIAAENGGTGLQRTIKINANNVNLDISQGGINVGTNVPTSLSNIFAVNHTMSSSSATQNAQSILTTTNQSGTAGYRGLWISPYQLSIGSGERLLIDAGSNSAANGSGAHTSKFSVDSQGKTTTVGDVEITDNTKGIIMKSPDGTRYRVTIQNGGTFLSTAL